MPPTEMQVLTAGKFFRQPLFAGDQPEEVIVSIDALHEMVRNHDNNVYGQDIPLTTNHDDTGGALAWILGLEIREGNQLWATDLKWTTRGEELYEEGAFPYISAEWFTEWTHSETGQSHQNVFVGATMTIRPFLKESVLPRAAEEKTLTSLFGPSMRVVFRELGHQPTTEETMPENAAVALETPPVEETTPTHVTFTEDQLNALVEARLAEQKEEFDQERQALKRETAEVRREIELRQFGEDIRAIRPTADSRLSPATITAFEQVASETEIPHTTLIALAQSVNTIPVGGVAETTERPTDKSSRVTALRERVAELMQEGVDGPNAWLQATKELPAGKERNQLMYEPLRDVTGEEN